ncbi:MAG: class I SAM-dependent methyltransferase [Nocardioidaceae bacterium]|nr:class I SAM-dependent methyltransferase [Nocardioidaceae bacterium]
MAGISERVRRSARAIAADLRRPPLFPDGHFYSPVPSAADVAHATEVSREPAGVDLCERGQLELASFLDLRFPLQSRWLADNGQFGPADAALLEAMLVLLKPRRVVEVGSGHSTAMVLDVRDRHELAMSVTCIEPYPERLLRILRDPGEVDLRQVPVQDLPVAELLVDPGDVLFIDSTHVVKAGSDVGYLLLDVLPRLPAGAIVHVHDIFWPFEYPAGWLREGRAWNELYLLRALLTENPSWEILAFASWLWAEHPEVVPADLRPYAPGSIWLRRR